MKHKKEWFKKRIGKKIYRKKTTCDCGSCNHTVENGLVVADNFHAGYLFDVQNEMGIEYFDKPVV